jgi:bifunctional UDP-N-acetylglucosamine pyrophosphorylase/glucosamine-1-phosphate N-acetyltransferase
MKMVILAAGEGVRMHPLTYTRPKVMLPIAGKPILEHLLIEAKNAGIEEFIFVVGYRTEVVRRYFGNGDKCGVDIDYITQKKQLGTAHALGEVKGSVSGKFLVANGDVLIRGEDIRKLASRDKIAMSLAWVDDARGLGVVETEGDRVVRIHEKEETPPSHLANAGLYLLTDDIFPALSRTRKSPRGEYEITDSLQLLIDEECDISWQRIGCWMDLSYPWDLLEANELLMRECESRNEGTTEESVVIKGAVSVGKGTVVRAGSYIIGPVVIGEGCEIGPNCYIRPSTSIGDDCHIGSAVEVKNSIIMRGTKIPHHNYVGDSVIGEDCNLGAGTKVANLRLDKKDITVMDIDTGRHKLGAIMGDGVEAGINVSINVGSLIGNDAHIAPGEVVKGVIPPGSRAS